MKKDSYKIVGCETYNYSPKNLLDINNQVCVYHLKGIKKEMIVPIYERYFYKTTK